MWRIIKPVSAFLAVLMISNSCKKEVTKADSEKDSVQINNIKKSTENSVSAEPLTYKKYSGAWFDIDYPSSFKAENSQKSETNVNGYDSATFTSPDGKVQFYIFSPQWSGVPENIVLKSSEIQTDSSSTVENGLEVKRWTIAAKDGSYVRSYESTSETKLNINKVFGIKYAFKKDLDKYKDAYLHFKNSLEQFAD